MYRYCALVIDRVPFEYLQRTGNMSTAIPNKQQREISHLEYYMYLFQDKYVEIACESMESFINAR